MTDEAHQARETALAKWAKKTGQLHVGADMNYARAWARSVIAADPATAQITEMLLHRADVAMRVDTLHEQLAAAHVQITELRKDVVVQTGRNDGYLATIRGLEAQLAAALADVEHAQEQEAFWERQHDGIVDHLAEAVAQVETWQQMVDSTNQTNAAMGRRLKEQEDKLVADTARIMELRAEVEQLTDLKGAAETGARFGKAMCDTYRGQLAEAKEAFSDYCSLMTFIRERDLKEDLRDWLRGNARATLKRLEGNDG